MPSCNDSSLLPDGSRLEVRLYQESQFPPETLALLWQQLQESRFPSYVWADGQPLALNEFIRFFGPDMPRIVFLPFFVPDGEAIGLQHIGGIMWCDNVVGHRAACHFMFLRRAWGKGRPLAAIRCGLKQLFALPLTPPIDLVIATAHATNALAVRLWKQLGIHVSTEEMPGYFLHADGTRHAARFGYLVRDEFLSQQG